MQVLFSDFVSFLNYTVLGALTDRQTDRQTRTCKSLNIMVIQNYPDLAIQSSWNTTHAEPHQSPPPPLIPEPYAVYPHIPNHSISPTALRTTVTIHPREERG